MVRNDKGKAFYKQEDLKAKSLDKLKELDEDIETNQILFPEEDGMTRAEFIEEVKDGIGDMQVTIILLAHMVGMDSVDCLESAYNEIKGRRGKMENGFFVKNSE